MHWKTHPREECKRVGPTDKGPLLTRFMIRGTEVDKQQGSHFPVKVKGSSWHKLQAFPRFYCWIQLHNGDYHLYHPQGHGFPLFID